MKQFTLSILVILTFSACQPTPEEILEKAKEKLWESAYISYSYSSEWPLPIGITDTIVGSVQYSKNEDVTFGYDFITRRPQVNDAVFLDNEYRMVNHRNNTVTLYTSQDIAEKDRYLSEIIPNDHSPITFFRDYHWNYVKDTLIDGVKLLDFFQIENDTLVEDKKIYTENHIFINPANYLLTHYERRNYINGKLSQNITFRFEDYVLDPQSRKLDYSPPKNYMSKLFKDREKLFLLKEGEQAPSFELFDLDGNAVKLDDYKGEKILLNFSMIRCGACKIAMDQFSKPDFSLADNRKILYINPVDDQEDMETYMSNYKVDFPILRDAKEVGKSYGVSGYPIFYLLNEQGIIEKVNSGYQEEFIEKLRKK